MSEGNGVDLGSIYGLLLQLQQQMQDARAELKGDIAGLRNEMQQEFAAVRSEARRTTPNCGKPSHFITLPFSATVS